MLCYADICDVLCYSDTSDEDIVIEYVTSDLTVNLGQLKPFEVTKKPRKPRRRKVEQTGRKADSQQDSATAVTTMETMSKWQKDVMRVK